MVVKTGAEEEFGAAAWGRRREGSQEKGNGDDKADRSGVTALAGCTSKENSAGVWAGKKAGVAVCFLGCALGCSFGDNSAGANFAGAYSW
ncbi:MAG: hypothetical protein ACO4AI_08960, partial [Prochlorothrix sp.]